MHHSLFLILCLEKNSNVVDPANKFVRVIKNFLVDVRSDQFGDYYAWGWSNRNATRCQRIQSEQKTFHCLAVSRVSGAACLFNEVLNAVSVNLVVKINDITRSNVTIGELRR